MNHALVGTVNNTDQTNFPMLVSVTLPELANTAYGGDMGQANANDLLFTASDGLTKLNHEIEEYNPATGQLIAWVQVPTLSHSTNTNIFMYFGNASASNQQNATGVWDSNYKGVWHLPNGTTLNLNDSTSNGNNGTNHGATAASGQVDGGANFVAASSQYVDAGSTNLNLTGNITLEEWVYLASNQVYEEPISKFDDNFHTGYHMFLGDGSGSNAKASPFWKSEITAALCPTVRGSFAIPLNQWYHLVGVITGTGSGQLHIYLNGTEQFYEVAVYNAANIGTNANDLLIGARPPNHNYPVDGRLDEVRVSSVARSADWISTEYNNQSNPSSLSPRSRSRSPATERSRVRPTAPGRAPRRGRVTSYRRNAIP